MDKIVDFLKGRNVPNAEIRLMEEDNIDAVAIKGMTSPEKELQLYLSRRGDRLALIAFVCEAQWQPGVNYVSSETPRRTHLNYEPNRSHKSSPPLTCEAQWQPGVNYVSSETPRRTHLNYECNKSYKSSPPLTAGSTQSWLNRKNKAQFESLKQRFSPYRPTSLTAKDEPEKQRTIQVGWKLQFFGESKLSTVRRTLGGMPRDALCTRNTDLASILNQAKVKFFPYDVLPGNEPLKDFDVFMTDYSGKPLEETLTVGRYMAEQGINFNRLQLFIATVEKGEMYRDYDISDEEEKENYDTRNRDKHENDTKDGHEIPLDQWNSHTYIGNHPHEIFGNDNPVILDSDEQGMQAAENDTNDRHEIPLDQSNSHTYIGNHPHEIFGNDNPVILDSDEQSMQAAVLQIHGEPLEDIKTVIENLRNESLSEEDAAIVNYVNVYRENPLDGLMRSLMRENFSDVGRFSTKFGSEDGTDAKGLTREMFTLTRSQIKDSPIFFGKKEDTKHIAYNGHALTTRKYFYAGKIFALAIVHCGIFPRFFCPILFKQLTNQEVLKTLTVDDLYSYTADYELHKSLEALRLSDDLGTINNLVLGQDNLNVAWGNTQVATLAEKDNVIKAIVRFYLVDHLAAAISQMKEGFETLGVLNKMIDKPDIFYPVFCEPQPLTAQRITDTIVEIVRSEKGSNAYKKEEKALAFWNDLLIDVQDGKVEGITLQKILFFFTASTQIPVFNFDPPPTILFKESVLPSAASCPNELYLPLDCKDYDGLDGGFIEGFKTALEYGMDYNHY